MASKTEIGEQALEKLGAIGAGQTPDTEDQDTIDGVYDSVYQYLRSKHAVSWGPYEDVPDAAELPMIDLVANRASNRYGVPRSADEERLAFKDLKALVRSDYSGEPPPAVYY